MRVVRAFRLPITAIITALALSGCMRTTGPVAVAPQGDLDSMAYGQPNSPPPQAVAAFRRRRRRRASRGLRRSTARSTSARGRRRTCRTRAGAIRRGLSSRCRRQTARRRLWPGRSPNTYAIDAGGSITMPLIGSVPARGRTTADWRRRYQRKLRAGFIREPSVAVEIEAYRPFFILGEVAAGQYPYVPT